MRYAIRGGSDISTTVSPTFTHLDTFSAFLPEPGGYQKFKFAPVEVGKVIDALSPPGMPDFVNLLTYEGKDSECRDKEELEEGHGGIIAIPVNSSNIVSYYTKK